MLRDASELHTMQYFGSKHPTRAKYDADIEGNNYLTFQPIIVIPVSHVLIYSQPSLLMHSEWKPAHLRLGKSGLGRLRMVTAWPCIWLVVCIAQSLAQNQPTASHVIPTIAGTILDLEK